MGQLAQAQLHPIPDEPVPAIGYIRVSMAREEMISPEIQRAAIIEWARRMNRRIVAWIEDLDKTGRNFKRKIAQGIARIEGGDAREIVVYRYDRWGRNAVGSLANVHLVERAGGAVQSASEPYDAETAVGKYSRTNAFAIAEMQSDIIGENWQAALSNRVGRGLPATGTPRWGYIRKGKLPDPDRPLHYRRDPDDQLGERYEPDPALREVYIGLYERWTYHGEGSHVLVKWLNARGYVTTRGGPWTMQSLMMLLDSGFAAGLLRQHNTVCRCVQRGRCRDVVYVPGAQKPIISEELWQDYLAKRRLRPRMPPRLIASPYPMSGLIYCGGCGLKMTSANSRNGGRGYAYRCPIWGERDICAGAWVRRDRVEGAVLAKLAEYVSDLDARAAGLKGRGVVRAAALADQERLTRELVKVDTSLKKLARQQVVDEALPHSIYIELRDELLASRADIEQGLQEAKRELAAADVDHEPIIRGLLAEWVTLSVPHRREMLTRLIRWVRVYRGRPYKPARIEVRGMWEPDDQ